MSSKLFASILVVLTYSSISMAASAFDDESSREAILSQEKHEQLNFRIKYKHLLKDDITLEQKISTRANYDYVDPTRLIPTKLREDALAYFDANKSVFSNQKYIAIINFSAHSSKTRFFLVDMTTGKVQSFHVSHGKGSDTNNDGYAERFSNTSGSEMTSVGFYRVAETYNGKHGFSVRLDGLSTTNSNARARAIVIHPADYVSEQSSRAGRSWGCPALDPKYSAKIINVLKNGAMLYANKI